MYGSYKNIMTDDIISGSYATSASSTQFLAIWLIVALILALVGGIALYLLFLRKNKSDKWNKFVKYLHDFLNFRSLWLDTIIKATYLILALFVTIYSLGLLFSGSFLGFLGFLVIGNVSLRITYEFANLILILVRNTNDINKKLKD